MRFAAEHEQWYQGHLKRRTGERRDRLRRGHGHGEKLFLEKVWWPLFGQFDGLHPEYEVVDWRGMRYFTDFLWRTGNASIVFEIKGYGPHVEQTDRTRYRRELNRELFLQGLGFLVVSIPYDELAENAELVRVLVRTITALYLREGIEKNRRYNRLEREMIRLAIRSGRAIRPADAVRELGVNQRTAIKYLKQLSDNGQFRTVPAGQSGRIVKYEYIGSYFDTGLR